MWTSNKVTWKIRYAPAYVRDYYEGNVKYKTSMNLAEKKELMENASASDGFVEPFFKQMEEHFSEDAEQNSDQRLELDATVAEGACPGGKRS